MGITYKEEAQSPKITYKSEEQPKKGLANQSNSALDTIVESGIAGPLPYLMKHEELLPLLGQIGGGMTGGYPGSIAGAAGGNTLKQGIEMMKGKKSSFSVGDVGKEAGLTALFEGAFRLPAFMAYRKLRASAELGGDLKTDLALMKGGIAKHDKTVLIDDLLNPLNDGLKKIAVKSGPQAAQLNKWKLALEKKLADGDMYLDGTTLLQMEEQLGAIAQFKNPAIMGVEIPTHITNKAANALSKEIRSTVSKKTDSFAKSIGLSEWPRVNKRVSELMKITSQKNNSLIDVLRRGTLEGLAGGMVGAVTHNPVAAVGTSLGLEAFMNPATRNIGFKALEKTGIGKAVTLGATQAGRDLLKDEAN